MDILFLCRDGLFDSLVSNLSLALTLQESGKSAGLVFSGDALNGLCDGPLRWSKSLAGVEARKKISKGAKEMGLALHSSADPRELDITPLLSRAREAGVALYACPMWSALLKLEDRIPAPLEQIEAKQLARELLSAGKVIGTL